MSLIYYTKSNPKWSIDLNIRHKTIKLLGKKDTGGNFYGLGLSKEFLDTTPIS